MEKIIIFGIGKISDVISYYIERDKAFEICAYCADKKYINKKEHNKKPLIPFENIENIYSPKDYKMAVLVGYQKINKLREEKYLEAKNKGYGFINYVSPKTSFDCTEIGDNNFILDFSVVQPFVKIGNNNMFWSTTHIGHHSKIGNNVFLAAPKISGQVEIGDNTFLGVNIAIGDGIKIGKHCIVGVNSIVKTDIDDGTILSVKATEPLPVKSFDMEDILD